MGPEGVKLLLFITEKIYSMWSQRVCAYQKMATLFKVE